MSFPDESYRHHLATDHILESNLGARFNVGFLLMFLPQTEHTLLRRLVGVHEMAHVLLFNCLYGKIAFFLKVIALDALVYCSKSGGRPEQYVAFSERLNQVMRHLLSRWQLTQEGLAMYNERSELLRSSGPEKQKYLSLFQNFIEQDTVYSRGLRLAERLAGRTPDGLFRALMHWLGDINYLEYWGKDLFSASLEAQLDLFNPDLFLTKLVETLEKEDVQIIQAYPRVHPLDRTPIISEKVLRYYLPGVPTFQSASTPIELFPHLVRLLHDSALCPDTYRPRLIEMEERYVAHYKSLIRTHLHGNINWRGNLRRRGATGYMPALPGLRQTLYFEARLRSDGEVEIIGEYDTFQTAQSEDLKDYFRLNHAVNQASQRGVDPVFSLSKLDFRSDNERIINYFYPPTSRKNNLITGQLFNKLMAKKIALMNPILIKCDADDAQQLQKLLESNQSTDDFTIQKSEESLEHWLDVATFLITLVASSITIIDTLDRWLNQKKEEKKTVTIIIMGQEYESEKDQDRIKELLETLKNEID